MKALAKDPHQRFKRIQAFATALGQASQSTFSIPTSLSSGNDHASQPLLTMKGDQTIPPSQALQAPNIVVSQSQTSQPTNTGTFTNQSSIIKAITDSHSPDVSSSRNDTVSLGGWKPFKHRISRRTVFVGLAGLVVVGGVTWFGLSQYSSSPSQQSPLVSNPHLASAYNGTALQDPNAWDNYDFISSPIHSNMTLSSITQLQNQISGELATNPPLAGFASSGHFTGSVDTNGKILFTLFNTDGKPETSYGGYIQTDGSLKGTCRPYVTVASYHPLAEWTVKPS